MADQEEINKYWSQLGLNPELFHIYYPMGPRSFLDAGGTPTGAAGSTLILSRSLNNFPHMFLGIRVNNVYELPAGATEGDIAVYDACKRFVDGEQTIAIQLSQQSIAVEPTLQKQLVGGQDGIYWHPFPIPFPMAGGNDITLTFTRATSYPAFPSTEALIVPTVRATIYAATARADFKTIAPMRVHGGAGNPNR
jgi:hypothetical protein